MSMKASERRLRGAARGATVPSEHTRRGRASTRACAQVHFRVPALEAGGSWEARARLSGLSGLLGPEADKAEATLTLYGAPGQGTLTGAALQSGDAIDDMATRGGQFVCHAQLRPIVYRFKRLRAASDEE